MGGCGSANRLVIVSSFAVPARRCQLAHLASTHEVQSSWSKRHITGVLTSRSTHALPGRPRPYCPSAWAIVP